MVSCKSGGHLVILVGGSAEIPGLTSSLLPFPGGMVAVDL
jgi:hypothetical protein